MSERAEKKATAGGPKRPASDRPRPSLRLDFSSDHRLGPGKIALLEKIIETGSISAAGRHMDMSYRRAWLLVDSINRMLKEPAVIKATGGAAGGGATVTPFGRKLIASYRAFERRVAKDASAVFAPFSAVQD